MDTANLANLPFTEPPSETQYRRAALLLARHTDNRDALREVLEMIGYPGLITPTTSHSHNPDLCWNQRHPRTDANTLVTKEGRRCRPCRREAERRRRGGQS